MSCCHQSFAAHMKAAQCKRWILASKPNVKTCWTVWKLIVWFVCFFVLVECVTTGGVYETQGQLLGLKNIGRTSINKEKGREYVTLLSCPFGPSFDKNIYFITINY